MKKAVVIFLVISAALIVRDGAYPATARVTLMPEAQVQPARPVAIGDIARIDGPKESARKIGGLIVATGPLPGKRGSVESSYIKLRLKAEVKGGVEVRGAERVEIIGKCMRFSPQILADQARSCIVGQLPKDGRAYDVLVDRLPREIVVASGSASELRPRLLNPTVLPGPKAVAVDVVVDQRVVASATVALSVKATAEVLVAVKTIRQNEALSPENTAWDRRDISRAPNAITKSDSDTTGWVARRTLSAGAVIAATDVAAPFTVHKGETVALTVTCGSVVLRTTAEIKQNARSGDPVLVRPAVSREDVQASVLGPGAVAIAR